MSRKNRVSTQLTAPSLTPATVTSTTSRDHQSLPILSTGQTVQTSTASETDTFLTQSTSSYLTPQSMAADRPLSSTSGTTSKDQKSSHFSPASSALDILADVASSREPIKQPASASSTQPIDFHAPHSLLNATRVPSSGGEHCAGDAAKVHTNYAPLSRSGLLAQSHPTLSLLPGDTIPSPAKQDPQAQQSPTVALTLTTGTASSVTRSSQKTTEQSLLTTRSASRQSTCTPENRFAILSEGEIETGHLTRPLSDGNADNAVRETNVMSSELDTPPQASSGLELLLRINQTVLHPSIPTAQDSPSALLSSRLDAIPVTESPGSQTEQLSATDQTGGSGKPHFIRYMNTHQNQGNFKCNICCKVYNSRPNLDRHMNTHQNQRNFKCNICCKVYNSRPNLDRHMKTHQNQRDFKCDICNKTFTLKHHLITHRKIHSEERPFECQICNKTFKLASILKNHITEVHSEEKPFKCNTCGKAFSLKKSLNRHMKTHQNQRGFKCDICNKTFKLGRILKDHITEVHSEEKPFKCNTCGKAFSLKKSLNRHMKTHHTKTSGREKPFECDICGKGFRLKDYLNKHQVFHSDKKPFECDICGKGFRLKDYLNKHQVFHSDKKPFECDICGKGFKLKRYLKKHKKTHSEEKAFKCNICGKGFKWNSNLNRHKKTTHSDQKDLYSLSETLSLIPPSDIPTIPISFHQHTAPVSASQSLVQGIQPQLTLSSSQPLAPNPAYAVSDQSNRLLPEIQEPENAAPEYIDVNASNLAFPLSPKEDTPSPPAHDAA